MGDTTALMEAKPLETEEEKPNLSTLKNRLDFEQRKTRRWLKELEESLERLEGVEKRISKKRGRENAESPSKEPPSKKRAVGEEKPSSNPSVPSQIVVNDKTVVAESGKNAKEEEKPKVRQRDKNMFGMLVGHLQRGLKEREKLESTEAAQKRKEIEHKIDTEVTQEYKESMEKRKKAVEEKLVREQERLKELKKRRTDLAEATRRVYEDSKKAQTSFFLVTKANPPIYFLPGKHNEKTELLLKLRKEEGAKIEEELRSYLDSLNLMIPRRERFQGGRRYGEGQVKDNANGEAKTNNEEETHEEKHRREHREEDSDSESDISEGGREAKEEQENKKEERKEGKEEQEEGKEESEEGKGNEGESAGKEDKEEESKED